LGGPPPLQVGWQETRKDGDGNGGVGDPPRATPYASVGEMWQPVAADGPQGLGAVPPAAAPVGVPLAYRSVKLLVVRAIFCPLLYNCFAVRISGSLLLWEAFCPLVSPFGPLAHDLSGAFRILSGGHLRIWDFAQT
jgi:hypothetical protein